MPTDAQTGFEYDSHATILERVRSDFDAAGLGHSRLSRSLLYPFPYAIATVAYFAQGRIRWAVKQAFATLAATANVRRWGDLVNVPPIAEAYCTCTVTFTGANGTAVATGTELARASGELLTVDAPGGSIPGGGSVTLACTASAVGAASTPTVGEELTVTTPVAGLVSTAVVAAVTTAGLDEETAAAQALRIADRMGTTPQGGAEADYHAWIRASQTNVDKVAVTHPSDNLVLCWFTMEAGYALGGDVIPDATQIAIAQAYIDATDASGNDSRRPVTADVTVGTLTESAQAFTIADVHTLYSAYEADIETALADMFARLQDPGSAYTIYREQYITAIQNALPIGAACNVTNPAGDIAVSAADIKTVTTPITFP